MEALRKRGTWKQRFFLSACLLQLVCAPSAYADFINGDFEDPYTPDSTMHSPITGWTQTGYIFNGDTVLPPTNMTQLGFTATTTPGGISDIISGTMQTLYDYFLQGASPTPTFLVPIYGSNSAEVNLRSIDAPLTVSGTGHGGLPVSWTKIGQQATAFSQQIVVQASDIDPTDHKVHIRFKAAPVLENPSHTASQQPFYAFQLNNITTGRTGANPLFFQWQYSNQPGVPWKTVATAGTNPGASSDYLYTNVAAYDIAPGNALIHVGDTIELVVIASGCSPAGHDGHLYLDQVHTYVPPILWVSASGPISTTPGDNITYTYTYTNVGEVAVDDVEVVANLPVQGTPSGSPQSTTYISVTTPTVGTSPSCTGTSPVTCTIGTLQPGQTGTFQLTVNVPSGWSLSTSPVNNGNYPISGTGVAALLGPLVQTNLVAASSVSNLVVNASGLPITATLGVPYSGTFTCSNTPTASATGDAPSASCDISNLPAGLSATGCTISPSQDVWSEPETIPTNQTVTCTVTGTPTANSAGTAVVETNATNNSNSTTNQANVTITVSSTVAIPATVDGSPIVSPAIVCCGRPVLLGDLPIAGPGPTTYAVTEHTGNARCLIGKSGSQTFLKMRASNHGSCTIVGTKDGIHSAPLTVVGP